ncbi:MAG: L,D-transpeptidase family protein [Aquificaceae bacterium]|nr:L,D-transpeptidase family protein [Aquificaceae bacterium]
MAVALPLLFLLLGLAYAQSLEKSIRQSWNRLYYPQKVQQLYKLLGYRCLWFCEGKPTENFYKLQELLEEGVHHGLKQEDYRPLEGLEPEIALTDILIKFSHHLYYGKVDPSKLYDSWSLPKKPELLVETLHRLLVEGRLNELIKELAPKGREYWFLVEQARSLKDLSSIDWRPLGLSKVLRYGDKSPCLTEVRYRLFLLGDLQEFTTSELFDEELLGAVRSFQSRHGLKVTGEIDRKTLTELNVSPADRLRQLHLNLEKHRWLSKPLTRAVVVNIPSFELFLLDGGSPVLHSKVIVGRNYKEDFRPTPMLYSRINSLTLNPKWYVPLSISTKDILPKVKKDPEYLRRKGFRVFHMGMEVDPQQVDWSLYGEKNFPFRLVQESGPKNSLGRIKFNFPNHFAVYLHDTPDKGLFKHTKRAFSSGCIRVERAKELALYLLGEGWTSAKLDPLIKEGRTQTLTLRESVPIYLLYFTAFEREGKLHFREDLYGYDKMLARVYFPAGGGR